MTTGEILTVVCLACIALAVLFGRRRGKAAYAAAIAAAEARGGQAYAAAHSDTRQMVAVDLGGVHVGDRFGGRVHAVERRSASVTAYDLGIDDDINDDDDDANHGPRGLPAGRLRLVDHTLTRVRNVPGSDDVQQVPIERNVARGVSHGDHADTPVRDSAAGLISGPWWE